MGNRGGKGYASVSGCDGLTGKLPRGLGCQGVRSVVGPLCALALWVTATAVRWSSWWYRSPELIQLGEAGGRVVAFADHREREQAVGGDGP